MVDWESLHTAAGICAQTSGQPFSEINAREDHQKEVYSRCPGCEFKKFCTKEVGQYADKVIVGITMSQNVRIDYFEENAKCTDMLNPEKTDIAVIRVVHSDNKP